MKWSCQKFDPFQGARSLGEGTQNPIGLSSADRLSISNILSKSVNFMSYPGHTNESTNNKCSILSSVVGENKVCGGMADTIYVNEQLLHLLH